MKFAFLIMGNYNAESDRAEIHGGEARIIGVSNIDEAVSAAKQLQKSGVGCIELCGAFGEDGARAIIEATDNKLPIGFVTHLPEQNDIYSAAFGE